MLFKYKRSNYCKHVKNQKPPGCLKQSLKRKCQTGVTEQFLARVMRQPFV